MARASVVLLAVSLAFATEPCAYGAGADDAAQTEYRWLRVSGSSTELDQRYGTAVERIDYGRFQWAKLPVLATREADGAWQPDNPYVLDLGGQQFDPLDLPPDGSIAGQDGSDHEPAWHLVQFKGPIKREWLVALSESGLEPVQYIHPYTYAVWGERFRVNAFKQFASVRWAGRFLPRYGVQPEYHDSTDPQAFPTMALVRTDAIGNIVAGVSNIRGGLIRTITQINRMLSIVHMSLARAAYLDIASIPGVYAVQHILPEAGARGEMGGQSVVGGFDAAGSVIPGYPDWLAQLGHDGNGVVVAVVDEDGFRRSHLDLSGNSTACLGNNGSCSAVGAHGAHATHVAGVIAGTGATSAKDAGGFLRGLGIAPGAALVSQNYLPFLTGDAGNGMMVADGMLRIFKDAVLSGADIVNNSWGPTTTPQGYDIPTMQVDILARDGNPDTANAEPVLPVFAIMNGHGDRSIGACAPSSLGSPDEAKNLLAVGSMYLQDESGAQSNRLFDISANSGHGNACDGRRVPHLVAPGCSIESTSAVGDTAHSVKLTGSSGTSPACGTSMAAPVVSGSAALFIAKYRAGNAGATPSPALVKAAFTAVATDLAGHRDADGRAMGHRPDRFQGYGRVDLAAALDPQVPVLYFDQSEIFTDSGQEWQRMIAAGDPSQPMRVMLAWTDAYGHGLGGSTPAWVNDLDLVVETAAHDVYWGNAVGNDGWSSMDGHPDASNNLEGIFLSPQQHRGQVLLSVLAANIAADALHPFDPATHAPAQDFALVCYNCIEGAAPAPTQADLGVVLSGAPTQVEAGATFSFNAAIVNAGPDVIGRSQITISFPGNINPKSAVPQGTGSADWSCSVGLTVQCWFLAPLSDGFAASPPRVRIAVHPPADRYRPARVPAARADCGQRRNERRARHGPDHGRHLRWQQCGFVRGERQRFVRNRDRR